MVKIKTDTLSRELIPMKRRILCAVAGVISVTTFGLTICVAAQNRQVDDLPKIRSSLEGIEKSLKEVSGKMSEIMTAMERQPQPSAVLWYTMLFTGVTAAAAAIYAGLTLFLLFRTQQATRAATLVQLVGNNRHLSDYAQRDPELMEVIRGGVGEKLTPKQFNYVSLIAGQIMCAFECMRLRALSNELFEGTRRAFEPMLKCMIIRNAILEVCSVHPSLEGQIRKWVEGLKE